MINSCDSGWFVCGQGRQHFLATPAMSRRDLTGTSTNCSGKVADTSDAPLDLSIAKAQDYSNNSVFEVK